MAVSSPSDPETRERSKPASPSRRYPGGPRRPPLGTLKPVGLTDLRQGRALGGFAGRGRPRRYTSSGSRPTHLPEQRRVFRMIPAGLEEAEFARYGVMHRNTFIDAAAARPS